MVTMQRKRFGLVTCLIVVANAIAGCSCGRATEWLQPRKNTDQPKWGLQGGLQFAIAPGGFPSPPGGPRGLVRIGSPILADGQHGLVNYIAVEPVVNGQKGFSELEHSQLDNVPGKRFWTDAVDGQKPNTGKLSTLPGGVQQLEVTVHIEKFDNGAHLDLIITQRSDRPDEIELAARTLDDSAPLEYCILTATMGNFARARQLWLKTETASSLNLYRDYTDRHFAPHTTYSLEKLHRTPSGDVLVAITTDEKNPAAAQPFAGSTLWHCTGTPVTQYWKQSADQVRDDLHAAVNGRFVYWQSRKPIPGGISFENFELRERFYNGQRFVFGITKQSPNELGFAPRQ